MKAGVFLASPAVVRAGTGSLAPFFCIKLCIIKMQYKYFTLSGVQGSYRKLGRPLGKGLCTGSPALSPLAQLLRTNQIWGRRHPRKVLEPRLSPLGFTGRNSSWAASSGIPRSLGSGSWARRPAARLCVSAPFKRRKQWAGQGVRTCASSPLPWTRANGPQDAECRWAQGLGQGSRMVPPRLARFPSLLSSHLAMARKANSTFMPVLALVSMKGTPYSCQRETVLRAGLQLPPPLVLPTGGHLPWPASLHPQNVSPFHCSHLPVKPRWVTLGKEALTPAGPSPAPAGPSFAPGAGTARPLLVACGTASGMIGMEPEFPPGSG